MAELKFVESHNSSLAIDVTVPQFRPLMEYFQRSRLRYALTRDLPIVEDYIDQFWSTAFYDEAANPPVISATVANRAFQVSEAQIRAILQLGDTAADIAEERLEYHHAFLAGMFGRMGYMEENIGRVIKKNKLYGQWRYLAHVVMLCFSTRKSGFDSMNQRDQSLMCAITYNKPYNVARYVFVALRDQILGNVRDRFLLFPRFVQMILESRLPGLPVVGDLLPVATISKRIFTECMSNKRNIPPARLNNILFGHLVDVNFVAPPGDVLVPLQQAEGDVPVIDEVQQAAAVDEPQLEVHEQVVNDALDEQMVNPDVAAALVHDVLNVQAPANDVIADVDAFHGPANLDGLDIPDLGNLNADVGEAQVLRGDFFDDLPGELGHGSGAGVGQGGDVDTGSDDDDSSDDEDDFDAPLQRGQVIGRRRSVSPVETVSRKRKAVDDEDEDYVPTEDDTGKGKGKLHARPKLVIRRSSTSGVSIREPEILSPTATAFVSQIQTRGVTVSPSSVPASISTPTVTVTPVVSPTSASGSGSARVRTDIPDSMRFQQIDSKLDVLLKRLIASEAQTAAQKVLFEKEIDRMKFEHFRQVDGLSKQIQTLINRTDAQQQVLDSLSHLEEQVGSIANQVGTFSSMADKYVDSAFKMYTEMKKIMDSQIGTLLKIENTVGRQGNILENHYLNLKSHANEIRELHSALASRGEIPQGCRPDVLRMMRPEDRDDDPNAPSGSEMPSTSARFGTTMRTSQGESQGRTNAGSSSQTPVELDAMDIDETVVDKGSDVAGSSRFPAEGIVEDVWSDIEEFETDNAPEDELEEGEFVPEDISDIDEAEVVQDDSEKAADEYVIQNERMTEQRLANEKIFSLELYLNSDSWKKASNVGSSSRTPKSVSASWFRRVPDKRDIAFKKEIGSAGSGDLKKGIISWFSDLDLQLFVLKRFDGLQYLEKTTEALNSIPLVELKEIVRKPLVHVGGVDHYAANMVLHLKREVLTNEFKKFAPKNKGKYVVSKTKIDPATGRKKARMIYKPVLCKETVPVKVLSQTALETLDWWYVDIDTGEAVMMDRRDRELMRVYDPMHLINLPKEHLQMLDEVEILRKGDDWNGIANTYQNVVAVCVREGIHAGCKWMKTKGAS